MYENICTKKQGEFAWNYRERGECLIIDWADGPSCWHVRKLPGVSVSDFKVRLLTVLDFNYARSGRTVRLIGSYPRYELID